MRRFALPAALILGVLLCSLSGCNSVLGPTPPPNTPGFVNCSDTAIHQAALNLLPSIETALATGSYEAAIAALIAQDGGPLALAEAACAVQWVISKLEGQSAATSADSIASTQVANGKAWLAAHPVTFQ